MKKGYYGKEKWTATDYDATIDLSKFKDLKDV